MFIYNVTVKIENELSDEWLDWMQNNHIPDVMNTGLFVEHKICKLVLPSEDDGQTYAIQYFFNQMSDLHMYQSKFATKLQEKHSTKYKDKFVAFRTVLQLVD